jgi:uncharacterized protein
MSLFDTTPSVPYNARCDRHRPAVPDGAGCRSLLLSVLTVRFNVAQLLKSAAGASREYDLEEDITGIDKDLDVVKPLQGKVKFLRTGNGILVTGRLQTEVSLPCRRCLAPVAVPVTFDLEEQFHPSIDLISGQAVPAADDEEEATRTDARHILDLTEVVRQNLLLTVPMSALCSSQCRGLCPECGENLNEGSCRCQREEGDPRLAALRDLL